MTYIKDLEIDRYNLDEELVRQPQLYYDWAIKAAMAEVDSKEAKNKYELVHGEMVNKIKRDPERYGAGEKVSDYIAKTIASKQKRVKKYFNRYMDALRDEKTLDEAKKSFQQRKNMLESLTSLNVQLHFADPKVPMAHKEEAERRYRTAVRKSSGLKKRKIRRRKK
jgi:Cft2 family RNA processing exonuclease